MEFLSGSKAGNVDSKPKPHAGEPLPLSAVLPPITPEEVIRRRIVFEETLALRDRIGPIDLTLEELMAEDEDEVNE